GVQMVKEFGCPQCPKAGSREYVRKHIISAHKGQKLKPQPDVYTQILNKGITKSKLRVRPAFLGVQNHPDDDGAGAEWEKIFRDTVKHVAGKTRTPSNARYISPWIMRTSWHKLVENKNVDTLRALVAMPTGDTELAWVKPLVIRYMENTSNLIEFTSFQTLQRLNSSSPETQLNHTPFHLHHQHESTSKEYAVPIIHLIASLLRTPPKDFSMPRSETLSKALEGLRKERCVEALHMVFTELWLREWSSNRSHTFRDPTICFLGLFTLKPSGEFAPPKDVTRTISQLSRAIQLTVLAELHKRDLFSLQKYATTIVHSTISLPRVIFPNRRSGDYDTMRFDGFGVTIGNLQDIYTLLQNRAIELWEKKILLGQKLHVIYDIIADKLSSTEAGYCFLDDPNNPFKDCTDKLAHAIFTDPTLFKEFMMRGPSGEWVINPHRAKQWLQSLGELELYLLLGTEMKSGAPIRMTELTSTLIRNKTTRVRNAMGVGRYLALIRQYSKNTNNQQMDKMIPHGLSGFEQDLIIQVHTFARPLAMFFAKHLWPNQPEIAMNYNELLFMNFKTEFDSSWVSKRMGQLTSIILGWAMTISPYRHINISFKSHKCKGLIDAFMEQEVMSGVHALQSGHSVQTERRIYGLDHDSLAGISEDHIILYLEASTEYQKAFGIPPGGLGMPYDKAKMSDFKPDIQQCTVSGHNDTSPTVVAQPPGDMSAVLEMLSMIQSTSKAQHDALLSKIDALEARVAGLQGEFGTTCGAKCNVIEALFSETKERSPDVPSFNVQADHWQHDSMDIDIDITLADVSPDYTETAPSTPPLSTSSDGMVTSEKTPPHRTSLAPEPHAPKQAAAGANCKRALDVLRSLHGRSAQWRSQEQREAVKAVLSLQEDVIVVLPTGIGKSVIAYLPPQMESGVTVIVIPLSALLEDWKRRLEGLGIAYEHFEGAKSATLHGHSNIILVSSDVIRYPHWRKAISQVQGRRPVVRYVFDECHYYVTDVDFRPEAMSRPWQIRQAFPCQFVLLSATLPPPAQAFLSKEMALVTPKVISAPTSRPELCYKLLPRNLSLEDTINNIHAIVDLCSTELEWQAKDRYLIFVNSLDMGITLAARLNLDFYHANSAQHPIPDEKRNSYMSDWAAGAKRGLVCSSALAAGNDYSHVRLTVHVGTPPDMTIFSQQSGRAGRDGEEAWCCILPNGKAMGGKGSTGHLVGAMEMTRVA
ncbi:P-loop containing nucleoside triphosphate hydrolase protein, partial [Coprinellus micaceus]